MYANLFSNNPQPKSALADNTIFGDVIRQVAEQFSLGQYNGKELIEYTKDNTDEWIKKLWMCYQNSVPTGNEFSRSYCAVGAWITIQTAASIVGCSNQFPKGFGGNVVNTFNRITNTTSIRVDTTPAVGSVFVRESTHSGNNHMGIVVSVNESGTTIQTIEWNAGLDQVGASVNKNKSRVYGGVSHVAYYPEKYNQFKYWKFLHFEEMCNVQTLPCGSYSDTCFNIAIEITGCEKTVVDYPPDNPPVQKKYTPVCDNHTCPPGYRKLTVAEQIERGATAISSQKSSTEYYNQLCCVPSNTPPPPPNKKCPTIITKSCAQGSLQVNYPNVVPNFREVSIGQYNSWSFPDLLTDFETQGWKKAMATDVFPVVTDKNGNTFIILTPNSVMHEYVRQYKLDGGNKAVNIPFNVGSKIESWTEATHSTTFMQQMADLFLPPNSDKRNLKDKSNWGNTTQFKDEFPRYNNRQTPQGLGLPDFLSGDQSFYGAMDIIEKSGKKYDKTFVFVGIGVQQSDNSIIGKVLEQSFTTITNVALKAVNAPPLVLEKINQVLQTLQQLDKNPSISNIFLLAQAVLPDNYTPYLSKAQNIAAVINNPNVGNINKALQDAQAIAKELNGGDMPEWFKWGESQVNGAYLFAQNQYKAITDFVHATDEQVAKTVQSYSNYATALMGNGMGELGWNGKLSDLYSRGKSIFSDNGYTDKLTGESRVGLQNIFTTSTNGGALALLPKAQELIGGILSVGDFYKKTVSDVSEHAALMAIATGKKFVDDQVRGFQLQSLLHKAEDAVRANIPFALPSIWSFAETSELKDVGECWAREIEICLNMNVCRTPKLMVNGLCTNPPTTPPKNPQTTTVNNNKLKVNPFTDTSVIEQPPVEIPLPECIVRLSTGDYYYCPDTKCDSMIWKNLNAVNPQQNRDEIVNPNDFVNPTNPNIGVDPTKPNKPLVPINGNANGGTGYYGNLNQFSNQTELPTTYNDDQAAFYADQKQGYAGSPQIADPNCNILYPALFSKGMWYASINGKYVTITSCCPSEMPTVSNDCCDATQKNIAALAQQITKLQELVLRNSAGETTPAVDLTNITRELSAIHILVDSLRNQKPYDIKQIDITPLQKQINDLQTAVNNIKVTVPQANGQVVQQYNDSGLRQQIAELRSLITQTKNDSERPLQDELQVILTNLNDLRTAYDRNLQILKNEIRTQGNTPILQTDYNRLMNEKNAQITEYQKRIQDLQTRIQTQTQTQQSTTTGTTTTPAIPTNTTTPQVPARVPTTRTPTQQQPNGDCPDCYVLEETHTRKIREYPQQPPSHYNCNSDDC